MLERRYSDIRESKPCQYWHNRAISIQLRFFFLFFPNHITETKFDYDLQPEITKSNIVIAVTHPNLSKNLFFVCF